MKAHSLDSNGYSARGLGTPSGTPMVLRYVVLSWKSWDEIETNTLQSIWTGNLTAVFAPQAGNEDLKFQTLEFVIDKTEEYISRSQLERVLTQGSPLMNKSPKMSRTPGKSKAMKMQQEALSVNDFPSAPVNEFGVTSAVMQFFEVNSRNDSGFRKSWKLTNVGGSPADKRADVLYARSHGIFADQRRHTSRRRGSFVARSTRWGQ